jgi:hypothetical protein
MKNSYELPSASRPWAIWRGGAATVSGQILPSGILSRPFRRSIPHALIESCLGSTNWPQSGIGCPSEASSRSPGRA